MGTEWCVENSLRWCSAHSLYTHFLFRPFGSSPFLGSISLFSRPRFDGSFIFSRARLFPSQMTIQPSTYRRRSGHGIRIKGEGARQTLRTHWRKLEREKRWSWGLKTASLRHCRSSGSHRTLSASLWRPLWTLFIPSLSGGRGASCVAGKEQCRMSKEKKEPLTCR